MLGLRLAASVVVCATFVFISPQPGTAQCEPRWLPGPPGDDFDGTARVLTTWDPDGSGPLDDWLLIGGNFDQIGDILANNIAAWDGTDWHGFGDGFTNFRSSSGHDGVLDIEVFEGSLIVAGRFRSSGSQLVESIARWDGTAWQPMGAGLNGIVRALAVHDGQLFAAGRFGSLASPDVACVARWDGTSWHLFGEATNGFAYDCTSYRGELVVGGYFDSLDGVPVRSIARWNGLTWSWSGSGLDGVRGRYVTRMAVLGDELYVGGAFDEIDGTPMHSIGAWNGGDWRAIFALNFYSIEMLAHADDQLIVSGTASGGDPSSGGAFVGDGYNWQRLDTVSRTYAFSGARFQGEFHVGGYCSTVVDNARRDARLARWDGEEWRALGNPPAIDEWISALVEFQGKVFAAGQLSVRGSDSMHVATWNGQDWDGLAKRPLLPPPNRGGGIWLLSVFRDHLFAGGAMSTNGLDRNLFFVGWDGFEWHPVPGAPNDAVTAAVEFDGDLIVAGGFGFADGQRVNGVVRWNGDQWSQLDGGFDRWVNDVEVYNGELYAAGAFERAFDAETGDSRSMFGMARWDGARWQSMNLPEDAEIYALEVFNGDLYAAGQSNVYYEEYEAYLDGVSAWDGTSWRTVHDPMITAFFMTKYQGRLIVAGGFDEIYESPMNSIAAWDGASWHPLGTGLRWGISFGEGAMLGTADGLFISGELGTVGGQVTGTWARWATSEAGDADFDRVVTIADLATLLSNLGTTRDMNRRDGDTDDDGDVDLSDLAQLLSVFGSDCR